MRLALVFFCIIATRSCCKSNSESVSKMDYQAVINGSGKSPCSGKLDLIIHLMIASAVLITGGGSAEIYHPDRDSVCVLPDLPDSRLSHTQDGSLMCGGWELCRSCRRWNPESGAWDLVTEALTEDSVECKER